MITKILQKIRGHCHPHYFCNNIINIHPNDFPFVRKSFQLIELSKKKNLILFKKLFVISFDSIFQHKIFVEEYFPDFMLFQFSSLYFCFQSISTLKIVNIMQKRDCFDASLICAHLEMWLSSIFPRITLFCLEDSVEVFPSNNTS